MALWVPRCVFCVLFKEYTLKINKHYFTTHLNSQLKVFNRHITSIRNLYRTVSTLSIKQRNISGTAHIFHTGHTGITRGRHDGLNSYRGKTWYHFDGVRSGEFVRRRHVLQATIRLDT